MNRKEKILTALRVFARQRSGIEYNDYASWQSFNSERRSITRDLAAVNRLLGAVSWRDSITADDLLQAAKHAYSGRLTLTERPDGSVAIDYCTGQYFPTEYRKAVAAVLASALWDYQRGNMPNPEPASPGDWIRNQFRREFGPSLQSRYFN